MSGSTGSTGWPASGSMPGGMSGSIPTRRRLLQGPGSWAASGSSWDSGAGYPTGSAGSGGTDSYSSTGWTDSGSGAWSGSSAGGGESGWTGSGSVMYYGAAAGSGSGGPSGFERYPVVCGASGRYVTLSFPRMLPPGRAGRLAVRLCTVRAADQDAYGDAALDVQKAPGYA